GVWSRYARLAFARQRARRSRTAKRRYPNRTRDAANSRNRINSGSWLARWLSYLMLDRAITMSPTTRRSLSWYRNSTHFTTSRQTRGFRPFFGAPPAECAGPATDPPPGASASRSPPATAAVPADLPAPGPIPLLPYVQRPLADPVLSAHLRRLLSSLHLPQDAQNLALTVPFAWHPLPPFLSATPSLTLYFPLVQFLGFGSEGGRDCREASTRRRR